jgi:hypothetical protein
MGNSTQRLEGGFLTVNLSAAAVAAYKRIKLGSAGTYSVCGLTDYGDAVLDVDGAASDTGLRARNLASEGTQLGIASGSVAIGDTLYSAASGCVSSTQGTNAVVVGKAKTAAADTGVVEYFARSVA